MKSKQYQEGLALLNRLHGGHTGEEIPSGCKCAYCNQRYLEAA